MTDYSKVCWSCGKETMVNRGDYYQCSRCGATYNNIPRLGPATLEEASLEPADAPFVRTIKIRRPTPSTARRAKEARKKAKAD